jgi:hypothetical protein
VGTLVLPVSSFLLWGWRNRKGEVLDRFDASAARTYYGTFFPNAVLGTTDDAVLKAFDIYYLRRFGRRQFALPLISLLLVAGFAICITTGKVFAHTNVLSLYGTEGSSKEAWVAVSAIAGAYMWVFSDFISRGRRSHFVIADVNRGTLRFIVAVPLAYALGAALQPEVGVPIGLFLGAFPTDTVFKLIRRQATLKLGMQDDLSAEAPHQLEQLVTVDTKTAEAFADEGISSVSQLAYCDPVDLAMRSGLAFGQVSDCASEALAFIYLGKERRIGSDGSRQLSQGSGHGRR